MIEAPVHVERVEAGQPVFAGPDDLCPPGPVPLRRSAPTSSPRVASVAELDLDVVLIRKHVRQSEELDRVRRHRASLLRPGRTRVQRRVGAVLDLGARVHRDLGSRRPASREAPAAPRPTSLEHQHLLAGGEVAGGGEVLVLVEDDEPLHLRRQLHHQPQSVGAQAAPVAKEVMGHVAFRRVADEHQVAAGALEGGEAGDDSPFALVGLGEGVGHHDVAVRRPRGQVVPPRLLQGRVEGGLGRPRVERDRLAPGVDDARRS